MPRIRASQLVAIVTSMVLLLFQQQAEIDEVRASLGIKPIVPTQLLACLLYTSDAAHHRSRVDLGGRRIIKQKHHTPNALRRPLPHYTLY